MHAKAHRIQDVLSALGVRAHVAELPETTRSAAEAAAAVGTSTARIAKSLVFTTDTRTVLVIASGPNRVCTDRLATRLGEAVAQPDAKRTKQLTGYSAGGVPPVGHGDTPPQTFLDEDLLAHEEIWAAAGTPHALFAVDPGELVRVANAEVIRVTE